jgi:ribosomal peptide maturation radical SAM protein 1
MKKLSILLISMPFSTLNHPSIGLSRIGSAVAAKGHRARSLHLFLDYAEFIGIENYHFLSDDKYFQCLLGEYVFSAVFYRKSTDQTLRYFNEILIQRYREHFGVPSLFKILELIAESERFIANCVERIDWDSYDIVGFTSSFQQTMPSLAFAQEIKQKHPSIKVIMGGANCEGEMGLTLLKAFDCLDAICSGEGEVAFATFVDDLSQGGALSQGGKIAGIVCRNGSDLAIPSQITSPVEELDSLPPLEFDSFFSQHSSFPSVKAKYPAVPLFETSRGCWWGAKHHCTFCGLNGSTMAYRSKKPSIALSELKALMLRYGPEVLVVDNILDMKYFNDFLPGLAELDQRPLLHYEVKVNLKPSQIGLLAAAGVRKIQPGIESLSTRILRLMDKGCTAMLNIQTLKLATEAGIFVEWGLLYGFPGERAEDYLLMASIIPDVIHLQPPSGITKVRADRFSPYFKEPSRYGIQISPSPAYRHIFHGGDELIDGLAYHFEMDWDTGADVTEAVSIALNEVQLWHSNGPHSCLTMERKDRGVTEIRDSRFNGEVDVYELTGLIGSFLEYLWCCRSYGEIAKHFSPVSSESGIRSVLDQLKLRRLIFSEEERVIGLPLRQPGFERALERRDIRRANEGRIAYADVVGFNSSQTTNPEAIHTW